MTIKSEVVLTRLELQTKNEFNQICRKNDLNASAVLRRMVNDWVTQQRQLA